MRADFLGFVEPPAAHAALLRRVGRFPFWRGESPLVETLEPVYRDASRAAMPLFADEQV